MKKYLSLIAIVLSFILLLPVYAHSLDADGVYEMDNITIHDNPIGVAMSRAYMEEKTGVIQQNNTLLLQLSFNNTQYMGNFTIKVNGEVVPHDIIFEDSENNLMTVEFVVNSLEDTISVAMYVIVMDLNVEYEVGLLPETLVLIETYTPEKSSSNTILLVIGICIAIMGILLKKFKTS
ncbi:MAG: hypothetical protein BEN19_06410 [Epulopiscium sp. Nuni2H_MBin003]|nr:MAG: hypothetical protein BEN19_06410 [Epulopiscium sp. Nuni2H_MBin003]